VHIACGAALYQYSGNWPYVLLHATHVTVVWHRFGKLPAFSLLSGLFTSMLNWIAVNQFSYDIQSIVLRISLKFGINEYFEYSIATAVLFCLRCKLVRHEGSTDHQYSPIAISSPMASLKNSLAHEIFAKCPLL
jgi:hypothetical protein